MAAKELEIKLSWENGVSFEMTAKRDAGVVSTVVQLDENGQIATLWPNIHNICRTFFIAELTTIGTEMKS